MLIRPKPHKNSLGLSDLMTCEPLELEYVSAVLKKENHEVFKETIGKRIEPYVKVEYSFQELNTIPSKIDIPNDRVKPLGTAHAILCSRDLVNEPFAMINADDFYGRDAFIKAYNYLSGIDDLSNAEFEALRQRALRGELRRT